MEYFTEALKTLLNASGHTDLYDALLSTYRDLLARRLSHVDYPEDGRENDISQLKFNCLISQQALLHRAVRLFEGALHVLQDNNIYALALCVRAHFETTGAMGYLYKRLTSFIKGNITFRDFYGDVATQLLGCRHKSVTYKRDPKNVMSQLDEADKLVDRELLIRYGDHHRGLLRDDYEFLSEFCHPNFHSNLISYEVDGGRGRFAFMYDKEPRNEESSLIGYLDISNPLFVWLFDEFGKLIPQVTDTSHEAGQPRDE
jgi:hypothetical protein